MKPASDDRTKRVFDFAVVVVLLLVTWPILLATALAIRISLGSPVLFRHARPGLVGNPFELVKFRSMKKVHPARGLIDNDSRITPLGLGLRSASLDELPGLWNVVKGDLSLVGQRPLMMCYLKRYPPEQARRNEVRAGVTALAQISGLDASGCDDKSQLDVRCGDRHSFVGDLTIIRGTVRSLVRRDRISKAGESTRSAWLRNGQPEESL